MSGARAGSRSRSSQGEPAPSNAFVAVLERRGRFLTAERIFPHERPAGTAPVRGRSGGLVIAPGKSTRGGRSAGPAASAGDLVLVAPGGRGSGARVLRRIGRPDVARDLIEAMMLDRGLSRGFDSRVEAEARSAGQRVRESAQSRRDLRALTTFTIDPAGARDFDDAISAEDLGDGLARVWVHIADVAAHVQEGSALDREARRRASSVYVPGAVEPMLPHALSSDACSLVQGEDRAAVTVEMELRGTAVVRSAFYRSLIRSDARLDYDRVQRIFDARERADEPWAQPLSVARGVAAELQAQRERSGALVLDSPEPEFAFDERGDVTAAQTPAHSESHRLIEHLMITANEAVAALLAQRGVPCLYRVHERPEPARIERLVDQLATLNVPTPPVPENMSPSQAAELVGLISRRVDQHVRSGAGSRMALTSLVLRSLKQAYYSPRNLGHAGLHSATYCHFTSPIRRYPDLVCHRALLSAVGAGEREPRAGELVELGAWTSERQREAMRIERAGDDIARCFVLERLLFETGHDQVFDGEITGLISAGAFIAFGPHDEDCDGSPQPAFEGMLPVRMLRAPAAQRGGRARPQHSSRRAPAEREGQREWWELNEESTILRGERTGASLSLGEQIAVRVGRIDAVRGRVDLLPAG